MEDGEVMMLTINFVITAFLYMILPIISLLINKNGYTKKELSTFVIGNSFLVYVIFFIIHILKKDGQIPNIYASVIYAFLNYALLHKNIKIDKEGTQETKEDKNN